MNKLFAIFMCACALTIHVGAADRPNILLIVADDMGYSALGCYGGEIQTPNLDRMAENGLRFTQFYNAARCWPSRASGRITFCMRRDFYTAKDPLLPSGLLGPVTVQTAELISAK